MTTNVYIKIPRKRVAEGAYFNATVHFRSGDSSTTPTSARWRLDNISLTRGGNREVVGWSDITPATSAVITVGPNNINTHRGHDNLFQITCEADTGLDTRSTSTVKYRVVNNFAIDPV